jgi:hypothetical protein
MLEDDAMSGSRCVGPLNFSLLSAGRDLALRKRLGGTCGAKTMRFATRISEEKARSQGAPTVAIPADASALDLANCPISMRTEILLNY